MAAGGVNILYKVLDDVGWLGINWYVTCSAHHADFSTVVGWCLLAVLASVSVCLSLLPWWIVFTLATGGLCLHWLQVDCVYTSYRWIVFTLATGGLCLH